MEKPNEIIELDINKYEIAFVTDPSKIIIKKIPEDSYLIYHDSYDPPEIEGVKPISFTEFQKNYVDLHVNLFIFIGLNRIVTPSNRCDFVQEYLSTLTQNIKKISIDTSPFIGEPWRLFFHYLYTNNNLFKKPHSYAMQTEWKHWFYRDVKDCCLSPENIKLFLTKTYSNLDLLKTTYSFDLISEEDEEWYAEAREHIFNKYHTPKSLINGLLKLSNDRFNLDFNYDSYLKGEEFTLPDLKIYRFMVEENSRRQGIYNAIAEAGRKQCH